MADVFGVRFSPTIKRLQDLAVLIATITLDTVSLIRDVLLKSDVTDPYAQIKKKKEEEEVEDFANRSGESSQHGIRKLLSGEGLGSRNFSELLSNIKRLAETLNVSDNLMLYLFLQRLPSSIQTISAVISDLTLETASKFADRIIEFRVLKSSKILQKKESAERAFIYEKNAIAEATLLRYPIPGGSLSLDASDVAIGGTFTQLSLGKWEPIAFFSTKLNKNQRK
ncbi:transposon Ty3-G Gag-Pol polyprotein [Nephila pilipes]|uniref:Transposon Ty3-G Gag-Pol polyprotein n=1 Tax=Nephila pilipes TaxID=299642 RepID=A0A8X6UJ15_NEPPI|nr:transposon Ty3-G Gag-Pol polyprotein [Nephila pilipes]